MNERDILQSKLLKLSQKSRKAYRLYSSLSNNSLSNNSLGSNSLGNSFLGSKSLPASSLNANNFFHTPTSHKEFFESKEMHTESEEMSFSVSEGDSNEFTILQAKQWSIIYGDLLRSLSITLQQPTPKIMVHEVFSLQDRFFTAWKKGEQECALYHSELTKAVESFDYIRSYICSREILSQRARVQALESILHEIGTILKGVPSLKPSISSNSFETNHGIKNSITREVGVKNTISGESYLKYLDDENHAQNNREHELKDKEAQLQGMRSKVIPLRQKRSFGF